MSAPSPNFDVAKFLAPQRPSRPDGPYSTYPKGAPPIVDVITEPLGLPMPVCITCEIIMRLNTNPTQTNPAWH